MKISKKQLLILQEGILLDDLSNYSDFEKKILKSLHKRYKDVNTYDIYTSHLAKDLHEKWDLPLDTAYRMAKIYNYKRNELFSENIHSMDIKHTEILQHNFNETIRKYNSTLNDNQLGSTTDANKVKYDLFLWNTYDGFTIYARKPEGESVNISTLVIFTDKDGNYLEKCILDIKYKTSEDKRGEIGQFEFESPEKMDSNSSMEWVKSMVEFVKDKISRTAF